MARRPPRLSCRQAMTINGGKPHAAGDRGQRYAVFYKKAGSPQEHSFGWTNKLDTARAMQQSIIMSYGMHYPRIHDRQENKDVE